MYLQKPVSAAFFYVSALLGAGFATGRELYLYFFRFGITSGIAGIAAAAFIFAFSAYKTLLAAGSGIDDYGDLLDRLFGIHAGKFFRIVSIVFFFVLFSAMSAASGEIVNAALKLPRFAGSAALCILCFLLTYGGKNNVSRISIILCPIMIVCCCILGLSSARPSTSHSFDIKVIPSAVVYAAYNILTSTAVLCTQKGFCKKQAAAAAVIIFLAIFSAGILCGTLTAQHPSTLPIYDEIKGNAIKSGIYLFVLYMAVITTALGNIYCLMPYFGCGTICSAGFLISLIGFDIMIGKIYFLFGVIGSVLLAAILGQGGKKGLTH